MKHQQEGEEAIRSHRKGQIKIQKNQEVTIHQVENAHHQVVNIGRIPLNLGAVQMPLQEVDLGH